MNSLFMMFVTLAHSSVWKNGTGWTNTDPVFTWKEIGLVVGSFFFWASLCGFLLVTFRAVKASVNGQFRGAEAYDGSMPGVVYPDHNPRLDFSLFLLGGYFIYVGWSFNQELLSQEGRENLIALGNGCCVAGFLSILYPIAGVGRRFLLNEEPSPYRKESRPLPQLKTGKRVVVWAVALYLVCLAAVLWLRLGMEYYFG